MVCAGGSVSQAPVVDSWRTPVVLVLVVVAIGDTTTDWCRSAAAAACGTLTYFFGATDLLAADRTR